jgi:hypothetical protein
LHMPTKFVRPDIGLDRLRGSPTGDCGVGQGQGELYREFVRGTLDGIGEHLEEREGCGKGSTRVTGAMKR